MGTELIIANGVTGVEGKTSFFERRAVSIGERLVDFGGARKHPEKGIAVLCEILEVTLCSVDLVFGKPLDKPV